MLMFGARPLAAQPLGALATADSCGANATSEEGSPTFTPRARRPGLRYVTFDTAGVADAGFGRLARLGRGMLTPTEVRALAEVVLSFTPDPKHLDSTDSLPAYVRVRNRVRVRVRVRIRVWVWVRAKAS